MKKESAIRLRVDKETEIQFKKYAEKEGKTCSEILREFVNSKTKVENINIDTEETNNVEKLLKINDKINVRLNDTESTAFKNYCDSIGETRSRILRKLVRELINNQYPDLLHDEQSMLRIVIRYLAGISRNFNQITVAINKGNSSHRNIDINYLNQIKKYVSDVQNELKKYFEVTRNRDVFTSYETNK
ncbi:MAG: hypothetical protein LEGION0398_MBIBDBAK_01369 [Legionellaceae bacterium]